MKRPTARGRSPRNSAQAFHRIEVLVATRDGQPVLFGQGGDPAIVGRNRGSVLLELPSDFRVMRQCLAADVEKFGARKKSLQPVGQLVLMAGLGQAIDVFTRGDDRHAKARSALERRDEFLVSRRQRAECIGIQQHLPHRFIDLPKIRGRDDLFQGGGRRRGDRRKFAHPAGRAGSGLRLAFIQHPAQTLLEELAEGLSPEGGAGFGFPKNIIGKNKGRFHNAIFTDYRINVNRSAALGLRLPTSDHELQASGLSRLCHVLP